MAEKIRDFDSPELGKLIPYGIYDLERNVGGSALGQDQGTASFAVETCDVGGKVTATTPIRTCGSY